MIDASLNASAFIPEQIALPNATSAALPQRPRFEDQTVADRQVNRLPDANADSCSLETHQSNLRKYRPLLNEVTAGNYYQRAFEIKTEDDGKISVYGFNLYKFKELAEYALKYFEADVNKDAALLLKFIRHQCYMDPDHKGEQHNTDYIGVKHITQDRKDQVADFLNLPAAILEMLPLNTETGYWTGLPNRPRWHSKMEEHVLCTSYSDFIQKVFEYRFCADYRNFYSEGRAS